MNFYSEEQALDLLLGKKGSPDRNLYEDDIQTFLMGDLIRRARLSQNMTQEELGEMIGVKKAQISRLEKGNGNMTIVTISKIFKALGATEATLDFGALGKVALW